ncbi:MAG: hypothetical protein ABIQ47_14265 [Tepidiformaceae bacterium]
MRTLAESFQVLNRFKGFGEPKSALWFVGIEEGGEWSLEDLQSDLVELYAKPQPELDGRANQKGKPHRTPVYPIASRVALGLFNPSRTFTSDDVRDFQHRKLGRWKSDTFLTNVYPLGKKSRTAWPEHYQLLGFKSAAACRASVVEDRLALLRELRQKHAPRLVVCHGEKDWDQFELCFGSSQAAWTTGLLPHNQKSIKWQPGLVLSQFFATQGGLMEHSNVAALIEVCKQAILPR